MLNSGDSLRVEIKNYDVIGNEELSEIAEKYDVSTMIVEHQIENHHLANMGDNYL
jgi:hypothetical protein